MKKITFLILILFFCALKSQDYLIKVEIDNSQRYAYETTYYKLKAEQYNREIADNIKNYSDKYFVNLQRIIESNFKDTKNLDYNRFNLEIERLKKFGTNILDLLYKLERNELTGSNLQYTIEKAFDELNYSINNGELFQIKSKMYLDTLNKSVEQMFENQSEEALLQFIKSKNGKSRAELWDEFMKYPEDIRFQKFLVIEARKL